MSGRKVYSAEKASGSKSSRSPPPGQRAPSSAPLHIRECASVQKSYVLLRPGGAATRNWSCATPDVHEDDRRVRNGTLLTDITALSIRLAGSAPSCRSAARAGSGRWWPPRRGRGWPGPGGWPRRARARGWRAAWRSQCGDGRSSSDGRPPRRRTPGGAPAWW